MAYDLKDALQGAIGAFSSIFSFFLLRGGIPLFIEPKIGLIIGVVWLVLMYDPFKPHPSEHKIHFIWNLIISVIICSWLSVIFKLVTFEQLMTFQFFGCSAWLTALLAIPIALLCDRRNILSIFDRYYTTKKSK